MNLSLVNVYVTVSFITPSQRRDMVNNPIYDCHNFMVLYVNYVEKFVRFMMAATYSCNLVKLELV